MLIIGNGFVHSNLFPPQNHSPKPINILLRSSTCHERENPNSWEPWFPNEGTSHFFDTPFCFQYEDQPQLLDAPSDVDGKYACVSGLPGFVYYVDSWASR